MSVAIIEENSKKFNKYFSYFNNINKPRLHKDTIPSDYFGHIRCAFNQGEVLN
jgi:hypothetical protein